MRITKQVAYVRYLYWGIVCDKVKGLIIDSCDWWLVSVDAEPTPVYGRFKTYAIGCLEKTYEFKT